ncbi:MAG: DNA polymerase III subunit delta [Enterobacteriaceae bacterium PSpyr]|nr:MAG: DNA polymerase III subunit delta [Enterobacteriaceae bacterium PSpyr]
MVFININKIIKIKKKKVIYLFNGNDYFLINENKNLIKKIYFTNVFINIKINNYTIWEKIFNFCNNSNFLINKKILFLEFENNIINNKIFMNIYNLFNFFNIKVVIVLIGLNFTNLLKKILIDNNIYNFIININCKKNNINNFKRCLNFLIKKMKFKLNLKSNSLFLKYFEGNIFELSNFLDLLLLIYPNGNINIINIKKNIYNSTYFSFNNLFEILINSDINKSLNILNNIQYKKFEPILFLYILQKELINIIEIKFNLNIKKNKYFNNYKYLLYKKIIKKLTYNDLNNAFIILIKIEKLIKINNNILFWNEIKNLFILLCK